MTGSKPLGPGAWRLECSDGVGGPDFTDLVVEVSFMQIISNYDSRRDAEKVERYLVERWPGPQNREPHAGKVPTDRPWTDGIEDVKRGIPLR